MPPLSRQIIAFAHRGAKSECPENTLPAFERALELGATGLESDAWITSDGVVVLDHDGVVGPIWRRRAISTTSRSELPGHIPALNELYQRCGTDFEFSIDVKDPAALEPLVEVARAHGAADRLWLCHNDWRPMAAWRKVASECHLVESSNLAWMKEGLAARVSALAAAGIDALNLHRTQWTDQTRREVHAVGLKAFGWDAQAPADIDALLATGVDGLYSDHVGRMMAAVTAHRSG
ncbi:MAG TPA: glycerophosphodiester phosphodiesterase [Acidimicrobiales bacterium]|jgi:glycerophosphoryl diester phosphodiesterase|nr:glycerophosphodiester phosphodiesterase [Acidimicrobiales bacterium]